MMVLRQSTAVDVPIGPFVDSTDGYTAETGLSPAVKLSKNGQTLGAKNDATTPVHDADGYYNCELDATDTNTVGTLVLTVVGSATSLPARHEFQVVEEAIYDAFYASGATAPATASALATVDSNVDAILVDTAEIGAAGAGLTGVPWNASWDAEVQSEVTDALNAYDPPTKTELDAGFAALNDLSSIEVNAEVDTALADYDAPTKAELDSAVSPLATAAALATVDGIVDQILVDTDTTIPSLIAALNDITVADLLTTQMTESYNTDGTAPTLTQAVMLILQLISEASASGTTLTVKRLDGSTTAATFTLNDSSIPTSITRAS